MSAFFRKRSTQRGAAMLVMLAIIALGGSWLIVSRLNSLSANVSVAKRNHNAAVLNKAKQALIGYVAVTASRAGENNPGRLPCPEAAGYVGTSNEGAAAGSCTLPKVGRLPWRTLGLDKLVDADSEPLWYVVSPGWAYTSSNLTINSNTGGQLNVDGAANDSVALIIAPGAAMSVQASAGCTARNQQRSSPSTSMNALDYIECFDTPTATFATRGATTSFNDQVVRITTADVLPAIEAAIAHRIEREIAPQLKAIYGSSTWGLSSSIPLFAYPAPFSDPGPPTPNAATYVGVSGTPAGLLPFNSQSCSGDLRCVTIVSWRAPVAAAVTQTGGSGALQAGATCHLRAGGTEVRCEGSYIASGPTQLTMSARADNVALGLRALDASQMSVKYSLGGACGGGAASATATASGAFFSDGSADIKTTATFPSLLSLSVNFCITVSIDTLIDHPILDSTDPTTGWFVRNEWYRLLYYAVAPGNTAAGMPTPSCTTAVNCLSIDNVAPSAAQRAFLILAGRSINGSGRPSGALSDYLDFGNATGGYERQPVSTAIVASLKKPFNDRIIIVDENP